MEASHQLSERIRDRIREEGPISFRDFMHMCLYYPDLGYYTNHTDKIGIQGDFYTSCCLSPAFGAMIARQLEEMWQILGKGDFTLVEYGAGTGMLCNDILTYLKRIPELYARLRYCIIEISPAMRLIEQKNLPEKVSWHESIDDIEGDIHCVLSNELLDNFPVHQLVMKDDPQEIFVDFNEGFREVLFPLNQDLKHFLQEMNITLDPGFRMEVNLDAGDWIRRIADRMRYGFTLTIDYGGYTSELLKKARNCGTLMCYQGHEIYENPFMHIGQQDITSHVNFSSLIHWGERSGLRTCGLVPQGMFLSALGFKEYLRESYEGQKRDILTMAREEAFISRALLLDMGEKYKVLIQSKNIAGATDLKGLSLLQQLNHF